MPALPFPQPLELSRQSAKIHLVQRSGRGTSAGGSGRQEPSWSSEHANSSEPSYASDSLPRHKFACTSSLTEHLQQSPNCLCNRRSTFRTAWNRKTPVNKPKSKQQTTVHQKKPPLLSPLTHHAKRTIHYAKSRVW